MTEENVEQHEVANLPAWVRLAVHLVNVLQVHGSSGLKSSENQTAFADLVHALRGERTFSLNGVIYQVRKRSGSYFLVNLKAFKKLPAQYEKFDFPQTIGELVQLLAVG